MSKASEMVKELTSGKHSLDVSLLSDENSPCIINEWLSTGCLVLDAIMGKGLPVGRVTEMFGDPSSGKSLIAAQVASLAQQSEVLVAYADTETAVSMDIMKMLGIKTDELIYASPDTVEEVFTFFSDAVEAKKKVAEDAILLLIWDSIAATSAKMEMEAEYGKATMGKHAQLISQALRKFTRIISEERICCLFLNQVRQKIGVMFGDDTTTFGGNAVSFHASVRVRLDLSSKIKLATPHGNRIVGMNTIATVVKNKVAMPYKKAVLPIYFGNGVDDASATMGYIIDNDIAKKVGQRYDLKLGNETITFSKANWAKLYDENYDKITDLVLNADIQTYGEPEESEEPEEIAHDEKADSQSDN